MRVLMISTMALGLLVACQTTTTQTATQMSEKPDPPSCRTSEAQKIASLEAEITRLQAQVERGYQTQNSPVKVANPLKLCKGVVPFVSVCLPTPKVQSTLPTYAEHKQAKSEMQERIAERDALLKANPGCK